MLLLGRVLVLGDPIYLHLPHVVTGAKDILKYCLRVKYLGTQEIPSETSERCSAEGFCTWDFVYLGNSPAEKPDGKRANASMEFYIPF